MIDNNSLKRDKTNNNLTLKTLRLAMISGLLFYGIFGFLDPYMMPSNYVTAWIIRYAIIAPIIVLLYILSYTKITYKVLTTVQLKTIQFVLLTFAQFGIITMIWISNPQDIAFYAYYAGLIIILLWGNFIFRLNFKTTIYFSVSTIILYNITAIVKQQIVFNPISSESFSWYFGNNLFLISAAFLSLIGAYRLDRNETRLIAISNELINDKHELEVTQQYLKKSEEKARIALNTSKDSIILCSLDGTIYDCNETFCNIINKPKESLVGKNHLDFFSAEIKKIRVQHLKTVYETKQPLLEITDTVNDITYQTNLIPIIDNNGEVMQIAIYASDITKQKKAEQALKESKARLNKSNKTKDKFLSIIAHDLKNPIGTILGFAELLNHNFDKNDSQTNKEYIGHIQQTVGSTYKLLENLLLWSQSQSENMNYNPNKENLFLLTNETIKLLNQSAIKKSITIQNKLSSSIYVYTDKNMLLTILRNLISNAIKFTPENGKVIISAKPIVDEKNRSFIEVSVKDNGIGIKPDIQSTLFDIATNTSSAGTNNESGTGLGLILCNEFILKHGGKIWVKSESNMGSEFIFTLPKI